MLDDLKKVLFSENISELSFLTRRALHLDYSKSGRFSEIPVSEQEAKTLAEIDAMYAKYDGRTVVQLHGIAPRSGTNYISDLLEGHPDIKLDHDALPELPVLSIAKDAVSLQRVFLKRYIGNERSLNQLDFLSHIGHGLIHKVMASNSVNVNLFKVPHVHHLNLFPYIFPSHKLIICVRDGRDVVQSSVKTWGGGGSLGKRSFKDYCREWNRSAEIITSSMALFDNIGFPYRMVRYEDAFAETVGTAKELCSFVGANPDLVDEGTFANMKVRGSSQGAEAVGKIHWDKNNMTRDANFKPIGRWADWTATQRKTFDDIAGQSLVRLGYTR